MVLAANSGDSGRQHLSLQNVAQRCAHTQGSLTCLEVTFSELVVRSHGLVDERTSLLALDAASAPRPEEADLDSLPLLESRTLRASEDAVDVVATEAKVADANAS